MTWEANRGYVSSRKIMLSIRIELVCVRSVVTKDEIYTAEGDRTLVASLETGSCGARVVTSPAAGRGQPPGISKFCWREHFGVVAEDC